MQHINVIGGGLAGCEAAYHIAGEGLNVRLWEMRPVVNTPVHKTDDLAELVCSNSLKSDLEDTAQGLLKREMRALGSLLLSCAEDAKVPAGSALAVDRELFSALVTRKITSHPRIEVIREEVTDIPEGEVTVIATGPLTSDTFSRSIQSISGEDSLYFYDAIAPSVTAKSLDMSKVFKASRYGKGSDDYYNCPFTREEYEHFYENLINADIREGHTVDKKHIFEGCMPVEVMGRRGIDTLRYGPMRPVGLIANDGNRPYAVVQLRQEDKEGNIYGMVGFQTRIRWGEQDRVFRLIPGLENAEFVRYGEMHRNTYINSPELLMPTLQCKQNPSLLFAGQITGVEGYMESAATGIIAGINAAGIIKGRKLLILSRDTMIGSLIYFITTATGSNFQPVNANFGILPPLENHIKDKKVRYQGYVSRAINEVDKYPELFLK